MSNIKKPVLKVLSGINSSSPPIWLMRQAGRYLPEYREIRSKSSSFLEMCYNSDLAAEITLQPITRFGFDAAIIFSDILVIPDALGQQVNFKKNEGPILDRIVNLNDIKNLSITNLSDHLSPIYSAISKVKKVLPKSVTLIGFSGAPWTLAAYMIQGKGNSKFEKLIHFAQNHPTNFKVLIDLLVEAIVQHLSEQIKSGAEVVQIFDTWASIADEKLFNSWCINPVKKIKQNLQLKHPKTPIISFPKGSKRFLMEYLKQTSIKAISLDNTISLDWANQTLPKDVIFQGNLDPLLLLGSLKKMEDATIKIIDTLGDRPHIFNLGHGVNKETNPDSVAELVRIVRNYNG